MQHLHPHHLTIHTIIICKITSFVIFSIQPHTSFYHTFPPKKNSMFVSFTHIKFLHIYIFLISIWFEEDEGNEFANNKKINNLHFICYTYWFCYSLSEHMDLHWNSIIYYYYYWAILSLINFSKSNRNSELKMVKPLMLSSRIKNWKRNMLEKFTDLRME